MSDSNDPLSAEKNLLAEANQKPLLVRWGTFAKLSGPGWLQGAITLGGGSLAGSLYIWVIGGYELLWLQPLMMIFGVLMLSILAVIATKLLVEGTGAHFSNGLLIFIIAVLLLNDAAQAAIDHAAQRHTGDAQPEETN